MRFPVYCSVLLTVLAGCSKPAEPWGRVSGVVSHEGKPVADALLLFSDRQAGVEVTGTTNDRGEFQMNRGQLPGLPVGTYQISVTVGSKAPEPVNGMMYAPPGPKAPRDSAGFARPTAPPSSIPHKYSDIATSGLAATIHEGENRVDLEIN